MEHELSIDYAHTSVAEDLRKYEGICSCGEWALETNTRTGIIMKHGDHVVEQKKLAMGWMVVEQQWMGSWTEPETSAGPEILSITGDIHPDIVQMETVMKDGRRRIWKRVA